ncbi:unnamed protein product [Dicrocoelium dendriticum]|nr:unnamed protein product [Dicrocoelium dendriticum]
MGASQNKVRDGLGPLHGLQHHSVLSELEDIPRVYETQRAVAQLRSRKYDGVDGISPEILKNAGTVMMRALHRLVKAVWMEEQAPAESNDALVTPLYKGKGSKHYTDNYRGVNLRSCFGKIFVLILLERLVTHVLEPNIPGERWGFRSGESTIDMVCAARQLQENCRERNQPLYSLFVDFIKAFDTVNYEDLWLIFSKFGCPAMFIRLIECLQLACEQGCS